MEPFFAHSLQSTLVLVVLFLIAFFAGRYAGNRAPPGPLRYAAGAAISAMVFLGGFFALHRVIPGL